MLCAVLEWCWWCWKRKRLCKEASLRKRECRDMQPRPQRTHGHLRSESDAADPIHCAASTSSSSSSLFHPKRVEAATPPEKTEVKTPMPANMTPSLHRGRGGGEDAGVRACMCVCVDLSLARTYSRPCEGGRGRGTSSPRLPSPFPPSSRLHDTRQHWREGAASVLCISQPHTDTQNEAHALAHFVGLLKLLIARVVGLAACATNKKLQLCGRNADAGYFRRCRGNVAPTRAAHAHTAACRRVSGGEGRWRRDGGRNHCCGGFVR